MGTDRNLADLQIGLDPENLVDGDTNAFRLRASRDRHFFRVESYSYPAHENVTAATVAGTFETTAREHGETAASTMELTQLRANGAFVGEISAPSLSVAEARDAVHKPQPREGSFEAIDRQEETPLIASGPDPLGFRKEPFSIRGPGSRVAAIFPNVAFAPMSLHPASGPIDRLRLASILDGISYLILLGIAMPLKYLADMPLAVRLVGSLHGFLFLTLCACLLEVLVRKRLSVGWCVIVSVCALFPFAPFFLDRKLKTKGTAAP
jgi:integral membrane protein